MNLPDLGSNTVPSSFKNTNIQGDSPRNNNGIDRYNK